MKCLPRLLLCLCALATIVAGQVDTIQRCSKVAFQNICANRSSIYHVINRIQLENAVACNNSALAVEKATACTMDNPSGLHCYVATNYQPNISLALSACYFSTDPAENCSDDCRNHLLNLNSSLGCCINSVFNTSISDRYDYTNELFGYPLWSKCGVQTAATRGCPGSLAFNLRRNAQRTCPHDEVRAIDLREICESSFLDELQDILAGQDCDIYVDYVRNGACSVNSTGTFCLATEISHDSDFTEYIVPLYTNACTDTRINCSQECRDILSRFSSQRGCCVNALHNSTFGDALGINQAFLETPALFAHCGVSPPPVTCMSGATGGATPSSLGNVAVILLLLFVVGFLIQ